MTGLVVDFPDVELAATAMRESAQAMAADLARLSEAVAGLLAADWRGAAASAFTGEWDTWHAAAQRVTAALDGVGRTLSGGGSAYADSEAAIRKAAS
jgi:WXG100 family type VII secretion target